MTTTHWAATCSTARHTAFRALLRLAPVFMSVTGPAAAQVLQDGDLVIAANRYTSGVFYGRFFRLRGQDLTLLFESGASGIDFAQPSDVVIDSAGRIVFGSGSCGGNENNIKLLRWDPATGVLSQLLCIPYSVGAGGPPAGFPPEATGLHGPLNGLHLTRSLKVSIDDDANGGTPQVGFAEAYGFSVGVFPRQVFLYGQWYDRDHPEAFRYIVDEDRVEPGISTALIPVNSSGPVEMFADTGGTYYAGSQGSPVFRAQPDLTIDVRARTVVSGTEVVVSGALRVAGRNELVAGPAPLEYPYFDNTAVPNVTLMCNINGVDVTDTNNPLEDGGYRPLADIRSLGVLNGGIFVSTTSPSSAFFFDLAPRDPFLITYYCSYFNCTQGFGPYPASADRPYLAYTTVHNGRILGGNDEFSTGRVFSVNASTFEVLADDPLLVRPRGVAAYPPETPALAAAAVVVRVDSPVHVLVTSAAGLRIGHDAAGDPVNDFGPEGSILALGPEGHPLVYAIINPAEGNYTLSAVGSDDGPYTLRAYRADTSGEAAIASLSGTTSSGLAQNIALRLPPDAGVSLTRLSRADFDLDGDVDSDDFIVFKGCAAGPARPYAPTCILPPDVSGHIAADLDQDNDADSTDFGAFQRCYSGQGKAADPNCACDGGSTNCGGVCTNIAFDTQNCGGCGIVCADGLTCWNGSCEEVCTGGFTSCSGICTDLVFDNANCGSCGNVCPDNYSCQGVCTPIDPGTAERGTD